MMVEAHARCCICRGNRATEILSREQVPTVQNARCRTEFGARAMQRGTIALVSCSGCGFIWNAAFDPALAIYGLDYENDQSRSEVFLSHMSAIADRVLAALPGEGAKILEIGCGQGAFLKLLARRNPSRRIVLHAIDPSYRGDVSPSDAVIWRRFMDEDFIAATGLEYDAIIARHVIEHIPDPVGFLSLIRRALAGRDLPVRLFLETPCFEWIANNRVLQDVFYEHVNYFTADTLSRALSRAGFRGIEIRHVFGGQYLWASALAAGEARCPAGERTIDKALRLADVYRTSVTGEFARWRELLGDRIKTAVWGAGAKGVTFAQLIDPHRLWIDCLIDVNPRKQGTFAPGSGHPIIAPAEAARRDIQRIVVMNPNYAPEIRAYLDAAGWDATLAQERAGRP
jgi:SAM-dependent methyltransferase